MRRLSLLVSLLVVGGCTDATSPTPRSAVQARPRVAQVSIVSDNEHIPWVQTVERRDQRHLPHEFLKHGGRRPNERHDLSGDERGERRVRGRAAGSSGWSVAVKPAVVLVMIGKIDTRTHTIRRLCSPNPNQKPMRGTIARIGIVWSTTA